jgi:hypothetical protein
VTPLQRGVYIGLTALLGLAAVLTIGPLFASNRRQTIDRPLREIVPAEVAGWRVRELDVADSEEMRSTVMRILQFDDIVFRSYEKPGALVQVYAAYWKPGSVPYGQAGVHTPDTCWVYAGWTMEQREHGVPARF